MNRSVVMAADLVFVPGRLVAQGRLSAAGQDRGKELASSGQRRDERVDAAVLAIQPSGLDPLANGSAAEAKVGQLRH